MITLFNRKELMALFSVQKLYDVREALDAVGIPYHTKFATPLGRVGGRNRGSIFQEPDSAHDYKIYVHKDDYDRAVAAVQPALRNWNN